MWVGDGINGRVPSGQNAGASGTCGTSTNGTSNSGTSPACALVIDDDDDEVQVVGERNHTVSEVEEVSAPARPSKLQRIHIDDDLEITGMAGDTLAAALPHCRSDCPVHHFHPSRARKTAAGNEQHCEKWWRALAPPMTARFMLTALLDSASH